MRTQEDARAMGAGERPQDSQQNTDRPKDWGRENQQGNTRKPGFLHSPQRVNRRTQRKALYANVTASVDAVSLPGCQAEAGAWHLLSLRP